MRTGHRSCGQLARVARLYLGYPNKYTYLKHFVLTPVCAEFYCTGAVEQAWSCIGLLPERSTIPPRTHAHTTSPGPKYIFFQCKQEQALETACASRASLASCKQLQSIESALAVAARRTELTPLQRKV